MLDLLIYLFENYISTKPKLNINDITLELEEAGFNNKDISSAFDWFSHLEKISSNPKLTHKNSLRVLSQNECEKISGEAFTFLTFLLNAKILNSTEFEVILGEKAKIKIDKALKSLETLLDRKDITLEQKNRLVLINKVYSSYAK